MFDNVRSQPTFGIKQTNSPYYNRALEPNQEAHTVDWNTLSNTSRPNYAIRHVVNAMRYLMQFIFWWLIDYTALFWEIVAYSIFKTVTLPM